jgi:hypothetical protein
MNRARNSGNLIPQTKGVGIVFLPLIEILTRIINHTNKKKKQFTIHLQLLTLTGKKPVIFARYVRLFNSQP